MTRRNARTSGLVYSTDLGTTCPECRAPITACVCRQRQPPPAQGAVVRVGRETRGRKGAGVTVITGVPLPGAQLAALASRLKKRCGSGGTVKGGSIEIQGDHRDTLLEELRSLGWTVKRAGG
jgi:translation initiation factor 1